MMVENIYVLLPRISALAGQILLSRLFRYITEGATR